MEQIIEHDMELDNADTTVQILEKALTVFQIAKPLLIVFILGIQTKNFKRFLDLVNIRRAERKLHAVIVLDILVCHVTGILGDKVNGSVHRTTGTNQLVCQRFALCHIEERPCFIKTNHLEDTSIRMNEVQRKGGMTISMEIDSISIVV